MTGYSLHRQDRRDYRRGGGVCVYLRHGLSHTVQQCPDSPCYVQCVCLKLTTQDITLIVLYIPPNLAACQYQQVNDFLIDLCDRSPTKFFMIIGDLNQLKTKELELTLQLIQLVNVPTRKNSILDKILMTETLVSFYIDAQDNVSPVKVGPPIGNSDHCTVFLKPCKNVTDVGDASFFFKVHDLRDSHVATFKSALQRFPWRDFYYLDVSVENKCELFYNVLADAMNLIPHHMVEMNGKEKPWFTPKLKLMVNLRYDAYRNGNYQLYNHYAKKVKKEIEIAKKTWTRKMKDKPNGIWKVLQDTKNNTRKGLSTSQEAAEAINEALASTFCESPSWSQVIDQVIRSNDEGKSKKWNVDVTVEKTQKLLQKLKTSKAAGYDAFPSVLAKEACNELAGPLTHLIALSFESKTVPKIWKRANVTPLPKCKNPTVNDFRPISVLSTFSKILEQYVVDSLRDCFIGVYGSNQFGFRPKYSTLQATVNVHDAVTRAMDDVTNNGVLMMSFDMAKAFDRLNHSNLIHSLHSACLPVDFVLWCCDFLQNRQQRVKLGKYVSSFKAVTSGVPQGGKLSPFLFCVHIRSLQPVHPNALMSKYADDVMTVLPVNSSSNLELLIDDEISNVDQWCCKHGLELNRKKTKIMIIKRTALTIPLRFDFQDHITMLGVTFSADLTWDAFVNSLCKCANQRIYALKKLKKYLQKSDLILIYKATILSKLEYNSPLLIGLNSKNSEKLEKVQRRCHRIICGNECQCEHFTPLIDRRKQQALKTFTAMLQPNHLLHHLMPQRLSRSCRSHTFILSFSRTSLRLLSFIPMCTMLVNRMHNK